MDEMREGLLKMAYNIRKMTGGLMMEEKKVITFGDILDLLLSYDTMVTLNLGENNLKGSADCSLWEPLKDLVVENIDGPDGSLEVWLVTGDGKD